MNTIARIILILSIFISSFSYATEYYVSKTGNNSTGDGSLSNPWRTPEFGAARLSSSGDILSIREGTYDIQTTSVTMAAAVCPAADDCTIRAYPGEEVILQGNGGIAPTNGVIGSFNGYDGGLVSNLTVDGLTIKGVVVAMGSGITIQNCDISVGSDSWSGIGQGEVIWIQSANNVTIRNCRLHDNSWGGQSGTIQNNGLIMGYVIDGLIIENCDIYNSVGTGITLKDDLQNAVIRYNQIYNNAAAGIWTGNNSADIYIKSGDIYQNIIRGNNTSNNMEMGGIAFVVNTSLINIHNNTFHNNYRADITQWTGGNSVPFTCWNNIFSNSRTAFLSWPYSASVFKATYLNYNNYYGSAGWIYRGSRYATISEWQNQVNNLLAGSDSSSVSINPGFLNGSGNYSVPTDFKRSEYYNNGRSGEYPSVMGAYISGNESIGYSADISDDTEFPVQKPSPPFLKIISD